MRRLVAVLLVLAFAAAYGTPAIAACRIISARPTCCCSPAAANTICAPDCCAAAKSPRPITDATLQLRGFGAIITAPPILPSLTPPPRTMVTAGAIAYVGLHQRAAPRLPLRI